MKKAKYIAPAIDVTEVCLEGMIAASIQIGTTPGGDQLVKEDANWDIWSGK